MEDGSTTTLEELHERVALLEPGVVRILEIPAGIIETLQAMTDFATEMVKKFGKYVMVVDLSSGVRGPSAEYRAGIVNWMRSLLCVHSSYVQPGNVTARVALRFMIGRSGTRVSVHQTLAAALVKARTILDPS